MLLRLRLLGDSLNDSTDRLAPADPARAQIISVLLLTIDDRETMELAAERMSLHRVRDSMGPGLEPVLGYLRSVVTAVGRRQRDVRADRVPLSRRLVNRILEHEDPPLARAVQE